MKNPSYTDKILAYQEGKLSQKEKADFEAELLSNPQLQEAYQNFQQSLELTEVFAFDHLKQKLKSWEEPRVKRMHPLKLAALAATFLLILGLAGLSGIWQRFSSGKLASRYYTEIPVNIVSRNGSTDANAVLLQMEKDFQADKFGEVLETQEIEDPRAYLLKAQAALQFGNGAEAANYANLIISRQLNPYVEAAEWLFILGKTQSRETDFAKAAIDSLLQKEEHPFREEAMQLQEDLNSTWRKFAR
ncbi:MAG: hypothetical protein GYB31_14615 [Bacteroidetes bacterium]|nr:hypothetical protein [Bacteroidota bacterium]